MEISLLAGCTLFLGVPGSTKFTVAPSAAMASCLVIYIIDAEYYVSICLLVQLLMTIVLSSSSSVVSSSTNLLVVLCVLGYNELTVVGSRFFLSILPDLGPVNPSCHPLHFCCFCCCCCCFQVSCWSITQFYSLSLCARIHTFPEPEPSGRVLRWAFMEAPDIACASSLTTLGICVIFILLS